MAPYSLSGLIQVSGSHSGQHFAKWIWKDNIYTPAMRSSSRTDFRLHTSAISSAATVKIFALKGVNNNNNNNK